MSGDVSITDSEGNTMVYDPETESYEPVDQPEVVETREGEEDTASDSEQEPAKQSTPDYPDDWNKRRR